MRLASPSSTTAWATSPASPRRSSAAVADVELTDAAERVRRAAAVVLPGVGAFRDASRRLDAERPRRGGRRAHRRRLPLSRRLPRAAAALRAQSRGRRLARAGCPRRRGRVELDTGLKVPQIGWNELSFRAAGAPLAAGLAPPVYVYFVHSLRRAAGRRVGDRRRDRLRRRACRRGRARQRLGDAVPPREEPATSGCASLRNFATLCATAHESAGAC